MALEKVKENIKKLAYFVIKSKRNGWFVFRFKQLEDEFNIPKEEIISIFNMFRKAKVFDYEIMSWDHLEEIKYDFEKTKEIIDAETGGFMTVNIGAIQKMKSYFETDSVKLQELIDSPSHLNTFVKNFYKTRGIPKLVDDELVWGDIKFPIEGGHRTMMTIFFENPKIINSNKIVSKVGTPTERKELEEAVPYKDEDSFRSALRILRRKLKESSLPMKIINFGKNKYILEIEKVDE